MRNEMLRLPHFLRHYRELGADHFLIVDNASDDGTSEYLAHQDDVSLWTTSAGYRRARFGLDWSSWLLMRFGHGRWCLTVDADELLIYARCDERGLDALTQRLDQLGQTGLGTLMLDLYPEGKIGRPDTAAADDPTDYLKGFDAGPWRVARQSPMGNLWVQGGVRERVFFSDRTHRSPTLNKIPLVKWNRRFAYVNSTHGLLPRHLNMLYDGPGDSRPCGVLLHTKFLPDVTARALIEKERRQHFNQPEDFGGYYDAIAAEPSLWHGNTVRYRNPRQLVELGLMTDPWND